MVDHELEFLILASDGLWDVVKNEVSISLLHQAYAVTYDTALLDNLVELIFHY